MNDKLEGLQVGRGLAALAVVIFHAKLILIRFPEDSYIKLPYFYDYGDIGVTFFFVISGFIIAYVVSKPSYGTKSFLVKRFFRLWPTYFFCTTFYVMIYLLHRDKAASEIGYSLEYYFSSISFWPMGKLPALHPGWSLEHEVLFYLLAALLGARFGVKGIFSFLLTSIIAGFLLRVPVTAIYDFTMPWDFHLLAPLNLCFLYGIGLYMVWDKGNSFLFKWPAIAVTCFGFILMILAPQLVEQLPDIMEHNRANQDFVKKYLRFTIEGAASFILLLGLLQIKPRSTVTRFFIAIGDRSYSLYLCHFFFIPIFQYIHREYISWPHDMAEVLCISFVLLSLACSTLVYRFIEIPSSQKGIDLARKWTKT